MIFEKSEAGMGLTDQHTNHLVYQSIDHFAIVRITRFYNVNRKPLLA